MDDVAVQARALGPSQVLVSRCFLLRLDARWFVVCLSVVLGSRSSPCSWSFFPVDDPQREDVPPGSEQAPVDDSPVRRIITGRIAERPASDLSAETSAEGGNQSGFTATHDGS